MDCYELKRKREVCWDTFLVEQSQNVEVKMHHPVRREKVMTLNHIWEGNVCGYGSLIKVGDRYRLYYRGARQIEYADGTKESNISTICMAESKDGFFSWYAGYKGGNAIEDFDSGVIFGDSVDRKVRFRGDLREYAGKTVRMKIWLQDCELYSFRFCEA